MRVLKKKTPAAAAGTSENPELVEDDQVDDQVDAGDEGEMPWDEELRDFESENNIDHRRVSFTAYRLDPNGVKATTTAWKWVDKIPDNHDVGLQVGGGKFRVTLIISKGTNKPRIIKHKVIWIDPIYDEYRAAVKEQRLLELAKAGPAAAPAANLGDTISQMRQLTEVFLPMMDARAKAAPANPFEAFPEIQKFLGGFMKQMVQGQAEAYQAATLAGGPVASPEVGKATDWTKVMEIAFEKVYPVLEKFGLVDKFAALFVDGGINGTARSVPTSRVPA